MYYHMCDQLCKYSGNVDGKAAISGVVKAFGLILEREHILTRTGDYYEFPLRKK